MGGGALWGLCHGEDPFWPLAGLALVPLLILSRRPSRRQAFFLGWLHGTVAWWVGIPWIGYTLGVYGQIPAVLSSLLLVLLALYLGIFHGAFAVLGRELWRGRWGLAFLGFPGLWVAVECLQGHPFGGFPWNLAAHAWIEVPGALAFAAWGGAYGVSFLVAWVNTGFALGLSQRRGLPVGIGLLVPGLLLSAASLGGLREPPPTEGSAVRVVQPNIGMVQGADWQRIEEGYDRLLALSREACGSGGALLIWPESAGWPLLWEGDPFFPGRLRRDVESLADRGCPVLFNSAHGEDGSTYNSAFLLASAQEPERYDKRHLVPWGEYVPMGEVFPFIGKLARNAGNFSPGRTPGTLGWNGEELAPGICYESIFPGEVAEAVRGGATVLVNLSNDAWYGDSAARHQLFRAVRYRAAENRRPLVRAAITGISALVAADGRVVDRLDLDQVGVLAGRIRGRGDLSPYTRWPALVPWISFLGAAFAIMAAWRKTS